MTEVSLKQKKIDNVFTDSVEFPYKNFPEQKERCVSDYTI